MGLEVAAARALAPSFGTSIEVWGVLISTILAAMATGYAAGGWLIDRWPTSRTLYAALLGSSALQLASVATLSSLLRWVRDWPEPVGTLMASMCIAGAPTALLAATCPCVVRLNHRAGASGRTAGLAYALTTVGSISGVLVTTFFLLPQFGTRTTFAFLCVLTAIGGLVGHAFDGRPPGDRDRTIERIATLGALALLAVVAPLIFGLVANDHLHHPEGPEGRERPAPDRVLWEGESVYNPVRVVQLGPQLRGLILGRDDALHTAVVIDANGRPAPEPTGAYWDLFAVGPLLSPGSRVLSLGMGAGASIHAARWANPNLKFDAVEIDPVIVELARQYFGIEEDQTLRVHVADARRFLAQNPDARYDIIQVDLFRGYAAIPFHLATVEFYQEIAHHLEPPGVVMINVFDISPTAEVLQRIERTLATVFPSVYVHSMHDMNHMILAFPQRRALKDVARQLDDAKTPNVAAIARDVSTELRAFASDVGPSAPLMTDDRNDIERWTHRMLAEGRRAGRLPRRPH